MKATRQYLATLGTTGVLIASAVLVLLVGSALVAYRGWPGEGFGGGSGDVVIEEQGDVSLSGPARAAADAAPAADAVAARPAPGTPAAELAAAQAPLIPDGSGSGGGGDTPSVGDNPGRDAPSGPGTPGGGAPAPGVPGAPAVPAGQPRPGVQPLTNGVGNTTRELTDQAGTALGRLNPQLGKGVTDTGKAVTDLVKSLGVEVDRALKIQQP